MDSSINTVEIKLLDGSTLTLGEHADKVVLIVNTASECGLTPQYAGLEQLQQNYRERGLLVLGLPCNQFGAQEPGDAEQIASFCASNYGISFPLSEKIAVNGPATHPLYQLLKAAAADEDGGTEIKWNFAKFLLSRDRQTIKRYAPTTAPEALVADIEALL